MTLVARFGTRGIDLRGDEKSLRALGLRLRNIREGIELPLHVPLGESPAPYTSFATKLSIKPSTGPVCVEREQDSIVLKGDGAKLEVLAQNFETAAGMSVRDDHLHIEFYPGHYFLAAESLPLVVFRVET